MRIKTNFPVSNRYILFVVMTCLCLASLAGLSFSYPSFAQNSGLSSASQNAPAQNWTVAKGKALLKGNLGQGQARGSMNVKNGSSDWLVEGNLKAGLLNEDFSFGLNLSGGWLPYNSFGFWIKLDGEFTSEYIDHYQATVNLGYQINKRIKLIGTLDYLNKYLEIERWSKSGSHHQYGAGLSLDYQVGRAWGMAAFYQYYQTDGKVYGQVGDYEYVDQDNVQHYGWIYGGVRGGDYHETGLDLNYKRPKSHWDLGISLSMIWREYEEMLGHAALEEQNLATRLRAGWLDILNSGLNLRANISHEFSATDRLGWQLALTRRFGPVQLGINYSEQSNDQSVTDRRVYLSLALPLGSGSRATKAAGAKPGQDKKDGPAFLGDWLKKSVSGMGGHTLKVAQEVEQRVDQTIVDLDEIAAGTTVKKNLMTVSGLPALSHLDTGYSAPASAFSAFSIGANATSVVIDLSKLPKPQYIKAVFVQQDGLYTMLAFQTEKGSTKVTSQGQVSNVSAAFIKAFEKNLPLLKNDDAVVICNIKGASSTYQSITDTFQVKIHDTAPAAGDDWDDPLKYSPEIGEHKIFWQVSGNGSLVSGNTGESVKVKPLRAGGNYTLKVWVVFTKGDFKGYYCTATHTVTVNKVDDDDSGGGDGDGDSGSGTCQMLKSGSWVFNGGGFDLNLAIDASGKATLVANVEDGMADPGIVTSHACVDGKLIVNINCVMNGNNYSFVFSLDYSGGGSASGTVMQTKNGSVTGTYNVNGTAF